MGKHKHYDVIVAWASGKKVEWYNTQDKKWVTCDDPYTPIFDPKTNYRIKTKWQKEKDAYDAGQKIQWRPTPIGTWRDMGDAEIPMWWENKDVEYRIKPDPFADLKAAHAQGKTIQREFIFGQMVNSRYLPEWRDDPNPRWIEGMNYRIKPEVLVVERAVTIHSSDSGALYVLDWMGKSGHLQNVRYTFDPDTRELLSVEKI